MHNSLLAASASMTPPARLRPNTASAAAPRSAERFAGLKSSLAQLSETVQQRAVVGSSDADLAAHTRGGAAGASSALVPQSPARSVSAAGARGGVNAVAVVSESDAAWREIKENSARLQQHIALEVRRRAEGHKTLQQLVDARAKDIAQALERKVQDRMLQLHKNVDLLTQRVEVLNKELAVEREKNVRLTQELKFQASQGLNEVKAALELERSQRQEKESLMTKKLSEDIFRLQERLDVERHARDAMVSTVREEIGRVAVQRQKSDERIVQGLIEDIKQLKSSIVLERDDREKSEEHLAAALSDVVKQVQTSLDALNHL